MVRPRGGTRRDGRPAQATHDGHGHDHGHHPQGNLASHPIKRKRRAQCAHAPARALGRDSRASRACRSIRTIRRALAQREAHHARHARTYVRWGNAFLLAPAFALRLLCFALPRAVLGWYHGEERGGVRSRPRPVGPGAQRRLHAGPAPELALVRCCRAGRPPVPRHVTDAGRVAGQSRYSLRLLRCAHTRTDRRFFLVFFSTDYR